MNLAQYIHANHGAATRLSQLLGVSKGRISQISRERRMSADRAIAIEKATDGAVRCEDLMPNVDWAYLRGTAPTNPPTDAKCLK